MDNRTSSHQWLQIWIVEMHRWALIMLIITMQWQRMCGTISICICLYLVFVFLWLLPLYFIAEELSPRMPGLVAPTVIGLIFTTRHLLYHSYTCGPLSSNSKSNNATLVLRLVHMCFRIWIWVCSTSSRWCASCSTQWFFCQFPRWLTILCILLLKVFFC